MAVESSRAIVEWIVARIPLRAVKARIAGIVRKLPPVASLVVFAVPVAALFPFKLLGLWLLAHKHWIAASIVLVLAKLVGVAITAFVFEMTKPKLLKLRWFRWLYQHVLAWLAWAHQSGRPDQAADQAIAPHLPAEAGRPRLAAVVAHPPPRCARPGAAAVRADARRAARTAQSP